MKINSVKIDISSTSTKYKHPHFISLHVILNPFKYGLINKPGHCYYFSVEPSKCKEKITDTPKKMLVFYNFSNRES